MERSDPGVFGLQPVDFYSASRTHPQLARPFSISSVWIRDVKGEMESAVRVFAVDDVLAFGRFLVARFNLWPNRIAAQRNFISFQNLAVIEQRQRASGFHDQDVVGGAFVTSPTRHTRTEHSDDSDSQQGTHRLGYSGFGAMFSFTCAPSGRFRVCIARSALNRIPSRGLPAQRFSILYSPPRKKGVFGSSRFPSGSGPF